MIIPCPSCKEHIRFNEQERHNERECPERTLNCKYCKEPFHFKNIKVGHDLFRLARMLWCLSGLAQHIIAALYVSLNVTFIYFFRHMTRSVPSTRWSVKAVRRRKYPEKRYICKQHVETFYFNWKCHVAAYPGFVSCAVITFKSQRGAFSMYFQFPQRVFQHLDEKHILSRYKVFPKMWFYFTLSFLGLPSWKDGKKKRFTTWKTGIKIKMFLSCNRWNIFSLSPRWSETHFKSVWIYCNPSWVFFRTTNAHLCELEC